MPADAPERTETGEASQAGKRADSADRAPTIERINTKIADKYLLKSLLGAGGMGAVYESEHMITRRRVAVKIMHPGDIWSANAVERFVREARVAAAIGHPNIVQVLDAGAHTDGSPYMVLELLEGESLAGRIDREGTLSASAAVAIVIEVVEALAAAHKAGVVHRDIKPENVFVTGSAKKDGAVKLLDFGISKITGGDLEARTLTKTGHIVGTVDYMSPEQVRGEDDIDGRTDIWAIGVMLYRLLSGQLPFDGKTASMVIFNVMTVNAPLLEEIVPSVPRRLSNLVARALDKDRSARHATATELLADLRSCLDAKPGDALEPRRSLPTALPRDSAEPRFIRGNTDVGHAATIESGEPKLLLAPPVSAKPSAEITIPPSMGPVPRQVTPDVQTRRPRAALYVGLAVLLAGGAVVFRMMSHPAASTTTASTAGSPQQRNAGAAPAAVTPEVPAVPVVAMPVAQSPVAASPAAAEPDPAPTVGMGHERTGATGRHGGPRRVRGAVAGPATGAVAAPPAAAPAPQAPAHNAPVIDINGM